MIREHYIGQLASLREKVASMGSIVLEAIDASVSALEERDVSLAQTVIQSDNKVDSLKHEIEHTAFVLIATQQPAASDLREIIASMMIGSELERIADYASGIAKLTLTIAQEQSDNRADQVKLMSGITSELLRACMEAFAQRDVEAAATIWRRDDEVDEYYHHMFTEQIDEMVNHRQKIRSGTYMLWVAHNVERMADRVTNIAEWVAFVVTGNVEEFTESIRSETVPG